MNQPDLFPTATLSFSDFWNIWPRKTAKKISEQAWMRLSITNQKKALHDFPARYRNTPVQYIPHASTYLNQQRWDDDILQEESTSNAPPQINSASYHAFVPVETGARNSIGRDAIRRILKR